MTYREGLATSDRIAQLSRELGKPVLVYSLYSNLYADLLPVPPAPDPPTGCFVATVQANPTPPCTQPDRVVRLKFLFVTGLLVLMKFDVVQASHQATAPSLHLACRWMAFTQVSDPPMRPTRTVTFLFSDIEGSTRRLLEIGPDRYAELLEKLRSLLRGACTHHSGLDFGGAGDVAECMEFALRDHAE